MTPPPDLPRIRVNWWWILATVAVSALVTAHLLREVYPGLPDPMPVHWNARGEADGVAAKSVAGFLGIVLIGPGTIVLTMLAVAGLISLQSASITERGGARTPAEARRTWHTLRAAQTHLGWYLFGVNAFVLALLVRSYTGADQGVDLLVFLAGLAGLTALLLLVLYRAQRTAEERHPRPAAEQSHWRGGIYRNPEDPRLLVPNDSGMNLTVNLGHPSGKLVLGLILGGPLLLVLGLLFVLL